MTSDALDSVDLLREIARGDREAFRRFYDLNVTGRQFADAITGEGRVDIASLPC